MDVTFETQRGIVFTIEVGYFDTIAEIKEKIQKYREIPVSQQTLVFHGNVLNDDLDVEKSEILHKSYVRLIIAATPTATATAALPSPERPKIIVKSEQLSPTAAPAMPPPQFTSPPIARRIQIVLRLSTTQQPSVEVDLNDTVEKLKDKISEIEGISIPSNRIVLHALGNIEMQDRKQIRDYNLIDGSEVDVSVKPASGNSTSPALMAPPSRKLRVFVLPKCGTNKIMMDVNFTDKIQVLRTELEKLKQRTGFELPTEGYFFIYKQSVMEEKESFLWHRVRHGDTIEIFNGSVSGGS
ncbi:hypothetical protein V2J09_024294 [Rumex salicifolius]